MSRARFRFLLMLAIAVALLAAAGGYFTHQVHQVPEFYQRAITTPPSDQLQAGEQFEQEAIELQNQIRREGDWRLELTADEMNGWLATVLPEKFPGLLPPEVRDPRVALEQDRLLAAGKYRTSGIEAVVSIELSAFLTDEPNVIAVRVHQVAAGNLPIPLGKYLEQITTAASRRGIFIRWQEVAGNPLAIVTLPLAEPGDKRAIVIRSLQLQPGKVVATGTAHETIPSEQPPALSKE